MEYPVSFLKLIECFKHLSGVGSKSAERMAYDVLSMNPEKIEEFSDAIKQIRHITHCPICGNLSEEDEICEICSDPTREQDIICVVHGPKDVYAFEKMKEYHGVYHVLNGYISPTKNVGYEDINLPSLFARLKKQPIKEIILATDLTVEGEITAMYISKLLEEYNTIKVTRLAHGLPMGAQLDYADEMTLFKAFSNRKEIK